MRRRADAWEGVPKWKPVPWGGGQRRAQSCAESAEVLRADSWRSRWVRSTRWADAKPSCERVHWLRHGWRKISCLGFWQTPSSSARASSKQGTWGIKYGRRCWGTFIQPSHSKGKDKDYIVSDSHWILSCLHQNGTQYFDLRSMIFISCRPGRRTRGRGWFEALPRRTELLTGEFL